MSGRERTMTDIRPELSKKNKYWISRHRYYELKHFCLQYYEWVAALDDYTSCLTSDICRVGGDREWSNPTEYIVEQTEDLRNRIRTLKKAIEATEKVLGNYIFEGVTRGMSYETLNARYSIPCCKDVYYELYRKFFYILSEIRK